MVGKRCPTCAKNVKNLSQVDRNQCFSCKMYYHFRCLGLKDGSKTQSHLRYLMSRGKKRVGESHNKVKMYYKL